MKPAKQHHKENHHGTECQQEKNPGTGYYKGTDPGTEHQKGHKSDQDPILQQSDTKSIVSKRWEH